MLVGSCRIPLFDFVTSLSRAMDLMSPAVVGHHMQVAYIAHRLGGEMQLDRLERNNLALAGALHDIGAFSFQDRLNLLQFEMKHPHEHAKAGWLLLQGFEPFQSAADAVRFHHVPWEYGANERFDGAAVPRASQILHLADRVAVRIDKTRPILGQVQTILGRVREACGKDFMPEVVEAFERLTVKEHFWLEAASGSLGAILRRRVQLDAVELDLQELVNFAYLMCRVVDFKSRFTATHSSGVAAAAVALARLIGFSARECQMMEVAAYLHDLGKLAIPKEILEKPGRLTEDEQFVMRSHVFYTYHILDSLEGFDTITAWSSLHQERVDRSGYPFHHGQDNLPLGSRIMAVADVFTALTEDRPYRKGMSKDEATSVMRDMANDSELDARIVTLTEAHFSEIDELRTAAQSRAVQEYRQFQAMLAAPIGDACR